MNNFLTKLWAMKRSILTHAAMFFVGASIVGGSAFALVADKSHGKQMGWQKDVVSRIGADMMPLHELIAIAQADQPTEILGVAMTNTKQGEPVYAVRFATDSEKLIKILHLSPFSGEILANFDVNPRRFRGENRGRHGAKHGEKGGYKHGYHDDDHHDDDHHDDHHDDDDDDDDETAATTKTIDAGVTKS